MLGILYFVGGFISGITFGFIIAGLISASNNDKD